LTILAFGIPALFFVRGVYLPILYGPATVIITFLIGASYSYATEGRQRREIKKTFTRYMDKTLVEHVLKNPHLLHPGGERYRITVFFFGYGGVYHPLGKARSQALALVLHRAHTVFTRVIISHAE
jgi:adenylate cyclase